MKEKNFQAEFKTKNKQIGVFELKLCKGTSIRFDAVKEHQREALLQAYFSKEGLYHKISDSPVSWGMNSKMRFTKPKPFDCLLIKNQPAFVVIMFYTPRKRKNVYYIFIEDWIEVEKKSKRKSATEELCKNIAFKSESYLKKSIDKIIKK